MSLLPVLPPLLLLLLLQTITPSQAAQTVKQGKWSQELGRWKLLPEASSLPIIYENPDTLSWRDAVTLCEENHAQPYVPGQPSEWFWLVEKAKSLNGLSMWLPMTDNMTEGVLASWDSQDIGDLPIKWIHEEPMIHNSDVRNCVLLSADWGYKAIMAPCEDRHAAMICVAQEERCCMAGPPETEAFIAKAGTKEVAVFMAEGKKNVYESFHDILSRSISGFKKGFTSSYLETHGELFSNLESQLQTYYLSGKENLTIDLVEDFRKIYQSVFIYQQQGDESYNDCIGRTMEALDPFASLYELQDFDDSEGPSFSIAKTMIIMHTLTKGFGIGEKAMNGILKASPPNRACWKEFPKMVQCLRCGLSMKALPCRGYCEQVTNLCFRHTLPLVPVWYELIDGMVELIETLNFQDDTPNGLLEHHFEKILSFITEAFNGAKTQCGDNEFPHVVQSALITNVEEAEDKDEKNEEDHEDDKEQVEDDENTVEENDDSNNNLQHLLNEFRNKLVWYREFWVNLPSEMCRENPWVGEGTCRNQSMAKESANSPVPVSDPNNPTKMELQIQLIENFNIEIKAALNSALRNQEIISDPEDTPIYEKPKGWCVGGHEAVVGNECIVAYNKKQVSWDGVEALCQEKKFELPQLIDMKHIGALNKIQGHRCCCCHLSANSSYWTSGHVSKEKSTKTYNKWVWPSGHVISPEECPACYDGKNEAECLTWSLESGLMPAECSIENPVLCQRPNPNTPSFLQVSMPQIPDQYAWLNGRLVTVPDSADAALTWEEASALCSEEDLKPYLPWNVQEFNDMAKIYEILNFDSSEGFWLPVAVYKEEGSLTWIGQQESEVKVETHSKHTIDTSDLPEGHVYSLIIPDDASSGSSATLECLWTDTDSIHAVMWFKDGVNFFTYWADRNVSEIGQNVLGITIDANDSNGEHITLSNMTSDSSGRYRCEVMLDEPSYSMTYMEGNLLVTEKVLWWNENPPFEWSVDENQCIAYSSGATFYPCEEMLLPMICEYTGDTTIW